MADRPHPTIELEARRLVDRISDGELPLRLLGGMAIRLRVGEERFAQLPRQIGDLDFVAAAKSQRRVTEFLATQGYEPEERFNAINREQRLLFRDTANERQIDVFIGSFEMCHRVPLNGRLTIDQGTLPAAELLMTKLQIVELNEKDLHDAILLLWAFAIGECDGDFLNGGQVASLCAADWGLWRTLTENLETVAARAIAMPHEDLAAVVPSRVRELRERIDAEPKSRSWRWRARIGERVRWYELPEEVER